MRYIVITISLSLALRPEALYHHRVERAGVWRDVTVTTIEVTGGVTMCAIICHQYQCDVFSFDKKNNLCRSGQVGQEKWSQNE